MAYSITYRGIPLESDQYTIDIKKKIFTSSHYSLNLDFSGEFGWTFNTSAYCTFKTRGNCIFNTEFKCVFQTGSHCTFKTKSLCTFNTESHCTFETGSDCTFKTGDNCSFKTGSHCTFNTGSNCTFITGDSGTFQTGFNGIFKTGYRCIFSIYHCGVIKCEDESPILILYQNTSRNMLTIPDQIMYIDVDEPECKLWTNKDLILNCKDPKFKEACNFFMKKD